MVAGARIVAIPNTHLLLTMRRADARIHVEHDAARRTASMDHIDPLTGKISERQQVLFGGEPSRLEAAHLARRGRAAMRRFTAYNPAHRRIIAQPFGVVYILISRARRPNTDCRNIPMRACRPFLPVLASARLSPAIAVRPRISPVDSPAGFAMIASSNPT
jgi:hypothetical protein